MARLAGARLPRGGKKVNDPAFSAKQKRAETQGGPTRLRNRMQRAAKRTRRPLRGAMALHRNGAGAASSRGL